MATYKDDLDILKAAEKDANKLSLNAITELDNKGLLGMYGGGESGGDLYPEFNLVLLNSGEDAIDVESAHYIKYLTLKDFTIDGYFLGIAINNRQSGRVDAFTDYHVNGQTGDISAAGGIYKRYTENGLEQLGLSGVLEPDTWYHYSGGK